MNDQTLLLRQVHPNFYPDGEVSSQAFFPFPKDDGRLSVYDGDSITAEESFRHYTQAQGLKSVGVWAVSGAEVKSVNLTYHSDPVDGNEAHAAINFGNFAERDCRKLAKKLKKIAAERGCLYQAE